MDSLCEQGEYYIKLMTFTLGISADVVRHYFEIKILQSQPLNAFLGTYKHQLFHQLVSNTRCCCCSGNSISITGIANRRQFLLLFNSLPSGRRHNNAACICCINPNTVLVTNIDISLICVLVRAFLSSPTNVLVHSQPIEEIKETRNVLAHLSTPRLSKAEYESKFSVIESAVLCLAGALGDTFQKMINDRIDGFKRNTKSLTSVLEEINKSTDDMKQIMTRNVATLIEEYNALKAGLIQQNEEIKEEMKNLTLKIESNKFNITTSRVSFMSTLGNRLALSDLEKCQVRWTFEQPNTWNRELVKTILISAITLGLWTIYKVYFGSLVIITSCSINAIKDATTFKQSIESFLQEMVKICNINTKSAEVIKIDLEISGEVSEEGLITVEDDPYKEFGAVAKILPHHDDVKSTGDAFLNPESSESKQVLRLQELFRGRFSYKEAQRLLQYHHGDIKEAVNFTMTEDLSRIRRICRTDDEGWQIVRNNKAWRELASQGNVPFEERQFACSNCDNVWWKKVPTRKKVSRCKNCNNRYASIPRNREWGWAEFKCDGCDKTFRGFGQMENTWSPCFGCQSPCLPTMIFPKRKRIAIGNRDIHSCFGDNCFNRAGGRLRQGICVHPKSLQRRTVVPSQRHTDSGSTVDSFLTQDDLASQLSH